MSAKPASLTSRIDQDELQKLRNVKTALNSGVGSSLAPDELLSLKKAQEDKENQAPSRNKLELTSNKKIVPESEENPAATSNTPGIVLPNWTRAARPVPDPMSRFSRIYQEAKKSADSQLQQVQNSTGLKKRRRLSGELDSDGEIVPASNQPKLEIGKTVKISPLHHLTSAAKLYPSQQTSQTSQNRTQPQATPTSPSKPSSTTPNNPNTPLNDNSEDKETENPQHNQQQHQQQQRDSPDRTHPHTDRQQQQALDQKGSPFSSRQKPQRPDSPLSLLAGISGCGDVGPRIRPLTAVAGAAPGGESKNKHACDGVSSVPSFGGGAGGPGGENGANRRVVGGLGLPLEVDRVGAHAGGAGASPPPRIPFDVNSFTRTIAVSGSKSPIKTKTNSSVDVMNEGFLDASKRSETSGSELNLASLIPASSRTRTIEPEKKNPFEEWSKAVKISQEQNQPSHSIEPDRSEQPSRPDEDKDSINAMSMQKLRFTNTFQISRQIMNDTPIKSRNTVNHPLTQPETANENADSNQECMPTIGASDVPAHIGQTPVFGRAAQDSSNEVFISFGKGVMIQPSPSFFVPEGTPQQARLTPTFGEIQPFTYNPVQTTNDFGLQRRDVSFGLSSEHRAAQTISPVRQVRRPSPQMLSGDKTEDEDSLLALLQQDATDLKKSPGYSNPGSPN